MSQAESTTATAVIACTHLAKTYVEGPEPVRVLSDINFAIGIDCAVS